MIGHVQILAISSTEALMRCWQDDVQSPEDHYRSSCHGNLCRRSRLRYPKLSHKCTVSICMWRRTSYLPKPQHFQVFQQKLLDRLHNISEFWNNGDSSNWRAHLQPKLARRIIQGCRKTPVHWAEEEHTRSELQWAYPQPVGNSISYICIVNIPWVKTPWGVSVHRCSLQILRICFCSSWELHIHNLSLRGVYMSLSKSILGDMQHSRVWLLVSRGFWLSSPSTHGNLGILW